MPNWTLLTRVSGILLAISLVIVGSRAQARVFDFSKETVASYFRGTGGFSQLRKDPFMHADGEQTEISEKFKYNYGGEFGVWFALSERLGFRLGVEGLRGQPLTEVKGKDGNGNTLFKLTSNVFALNPNITIEYSYYQKDHIRFFSYVGGGYAMVTMDNKFEMTSAGTSTYGKDTYKEKTKAARTSSHAGVGVEVLFTDNATFEFDAGYRYLPVRQLTFKDTADTIAQDQVSEGDIVRNSDGNKRQFDLSGAYLGLSFRFYIDII